MTTWVPTTLGKVLADKGYIRGPFGSALKRDEMKKSGIPVYEQKNAIYGDRDFRFYIGDEKFEELKRFQVKTNDLIISCSGTVGKISIINEEDPKGIISQALLILRPDINKVTLRYLYYLLSSSQGFELLTQASHGSVQVNIAERKVVEQIPLLLPTVQEQKAIAAVFSSLDNKIDLLHHQNQTLEAMAATLFRQWFVEEAQEDWEVGPLKRYVDIGIGRTPPRQEHQWFSENPTDVKWISIKDLGNDGAYIFNTAEYLTRDAVEQFNIPVIPENTVVLSFKMTVGRVAITTGQMLSNEAIAHFKFRSDTPFTVEYLYLYLKNYQYDLLGSTSSIVTAINSAIIKDLEIKIPGKESMRRFDYVAGGAFMKMRSNQLQISTLEKLRDTQLPKLMSGEIRIQNV